MILTTTTKDLIAQMKAQLGARLDDTIGDRAFLDVLSVVVAGLHTTLYKFGSSSLLQNFAEHASYVPIKLLGRTIRPLITLGLRYGVGEPSVGTTARYTATLIVLETGETLPAGSLYSDGENVFRTLIDYELSASSIPVTIVAVSSEAEELEVGDVLQPVIPRGDVSSSVEITAVQAAVPGDTEETYRGKVREAEFAPPNGGSGADFRQWAGGVLDVAAAYAYTSDLPNEVDLFVQSKTAEDGLASDELLAAVRAAVDYTIDGRAARRGVNDAVNYFSISRKVYDVAITGFVGTQEAKDALQAGLAKYLSQRRPFQLGLDRKPRKDVISRFGVGGVAQGIADSYGATFSSLEVSSSAIVVVSEVLAKGRLAKLGDLTIEEV